MNEPLAELDAEVSRLSAVLQARMSEADMLLQQAFMEFSSGLAQVQANYEERLAAITRAMMAITKE